MIELIITIAVLGFLVYLVTLIPMPEPFRKVIFALAILILVVFVCRWLGYGDVGFSGHREPFIRSIP